MVVTPPATECVTLAEAKAHLRVEQTTDDGYITGLLTSAREYAESYCDRALLPQTWRVYRDCFEPVMRLPGGPVRAITALKYTDTVGVVQTLATNTYLLDVSRSRVAPAYLQAWPPTAAVLNAVEVTYEVGYADTAAVPAAVKHASLIILAELYEHREHAISGTIIGEVPLGAHALLWAQRAWSV